jgi:hypothetical protein
VIVITCLPPPGFTVYRCGWRYEERQGRAVRVGLCWPMGDTVLPDDALSPEQLAALRNDPGKRLQIRHIAEPSAPQEPPCSGIPDRQSGEPTATFTPDIHAPEAPATLDSTAPTPSAASTPSEASPPEARQGVSDVVSPPAEGERAPYTSGLALARTDGPDRASQPITPAPRPRPLARSGKPHGAKSARPCPERPASARPRLKVKGGAYRLAADRGPPPRPEALAAPFPVLLDKRLGLP